MTETEKKKIRFQIAQIERTRPNLVWIDRVENEQDGTQKVYGTARGFKIGCTVKDGRVDKIFAVF